MLVPFSAPFQIYQMFVNLYKFDFTFVQIIVLSAVNQGPEDVVHTFAKFFSDKVCLVFILDVANVFIDSLFTFLARHRYLYDVSSLSGYLYIP